MRKQSEGRTTSPTIQEKIEQAQDLFETCGDSLRQNPSIGTLLNKLQECIENTKDTMLKLGVVAECKHCEERVKFKAREKHQQVICNVYVDGRWDHVEHFHAPCYDEAGRPFGDPED